MLGSVKLYQNLSPYAQDTRKSHSEPIIFTYYIGLSKVYDTTVINFSTGYPVANDKQTNLSSFHYIPV